MQPSARSFAFNRLIVLPDERGPDDYGALDPNGIRKHKLSLAGALTHEKS